MGEVGLDLREGGLDLREGEGEGVAAAVAGLMCPLLVVVFGGLSEEGSTELAGIDVANKSSDLGR